MKALILSILIIAGTTGIMLALNTSMEGAARAQSVYNLQHIEDCVPTQTAEGHSVYRAFTNCAAGIKSGGNTGDVFVINTGTKGLVWDNSADCRPSSPDKLFMTEAGVCSLFAEPKSCVKLVAEMIGSGGSGAGSWMFDDSKEYVEWITINVEGTEYVIGQGAQEDEVRSVFNVVYWAIMFTTLMLLVVVNV